MGYGVVSYDSITIFTANPYYQFLLHIAKKTSKKCFINILVGKMTSRPFNTKNSIHFTLVATFTARLYIIFYVYLLTGVVNSAVTTVGLLSSQLFSDET